MRLTISSTTLASRLTALSKVFNSKNSLPILDCYLFEVNSNQLTITASDSENVMTTQIQLDESDGNGTFAVNNRNILDAVKELPEQPLTLDVDMSTYAIKVIYMNGMFRTGQIKTVVVDEADRLMDLGFMPQLRSILGVIPEKHQTLLFSATFSATVDELAREFLSPDFVRVETATQATPVENVAQWRYDVPNIATKINLLRLLLADRDTFRRVMVFTETKKNADRIVEKLADHWRGELSVLHSNKAQNSRLNALNAFRRGDTRILVSSDVAARGIDIQDVSHVINFDIPAIPEEYVHRIGRTARAGKEGVAISFVSEKEEPKFETIEQLTGQQVPVLPLPDDLEISDLLMDEEKVQTANIVYQRGKPQGGGAFHQRSAKNSKTPQKVRRGSPKKRSRRK